MILESTKGLFFRLENLFVPRFCIDKLTLLSNNYKNWPKYGNKNKELYILSPSINDLPELEYIINLLNPDLHNDVKINLMAISPGCTISPHTDPDRFCAINIPIKGNYETSCVQFFNKGKSRAIVTNFIKQDGTKPNPVGINYPKPDLIGRVYYQTPICINTSRIHNVRNAAKESRIILSLGFATTRFSKLEKLQEENNLLITPQDKYTHEDTI